MNLSACLTVMKIKLVVALPGSCVGIEIASSMAALMSDAWIVFLGLPRLDLVLVDRTPFWIRFRWPILVAFSTAMNLLIDFAFNPGSPGRQPLFAAEMRVVLGCEPRLEW